MTDMPPSHEQLHTERSRVKNYYETLVDFSRRVPNPHRVPSAARLSTMLDMPLTGIFHD